MHVAAVEWAALGKAAISALVAAVAITVLFTTGLLLAEPRGGHAAPAVQRVGGYILLALCAGLVVAGLFVLFTTK